MIPRGKNILSCESALEIRGFGWFVRWDDELQINGLWLRQASRREVLVANSGQKSQSAVSAAQFEHEPGHVDFMQLGGSRYVLRAELMS